MIGETDIHADAAREGDDSAFAQLYDRVAPALYAWARFRIHGPMKRELEPEDIVQEVWWRALDAFARFDAERGSFRAWVFSIANNVLREALRRRPARGVVSEREAKVHSLPPELAEQLTSIATELGRREGVTKLVDVISRLTREEQRLFVQCGLEGQTIREVAPQLEMTEAAAQRRWHRLREQLGDHPAWIEFVEH